MAARFSKRFVNGLFDWGNILTEYQLRGLLMRSHLSVLKPFVSKHVQSCNYPLRQYGYDPPKFGVSIGKPSFVLPEK